MGALALTTLGLVAFIALSAGRVNIVPGTAVLLLPGYCMAAGLDKYRRGRRDARLARARVPGNP